ncbi:MAG: GHMP family kinase ATP-binding protein [Promethearchaeota archaeon]
MYVVKTPVRVAFGGGGTDVEPYSSDYGGYVINSTINMYFRCKLTKREDNLINIYSNDKFLSYKFDTLEILNPKAKISNLLEAIFYLMKPKSGLNVNIHGEPLKKAGLGASASLCTCLISGILKLEEKTIDIDDISEKAYYVEQNILKNAGGRQDQYASVYGGFNGLEFLGDANVKVEKLNISKSFKQKIEENLILFYTGEPHVSGNMVKEQVKSYMEHKRTSKKFLDKLKDLAYQMRDSLLSEDFERFGELLSEDLKYKTEFNPLLTTNYMKELNKLILNNGGIGGRVCGAGGGGCMIWLVKPNSKKKISELLFNQQGKLIEFKFTHKGLEISEI